MVSPIAFFLPNEFCQRWLNVLRMRRYIRHPAGVPLQFSVENSEEQSDAHNAFALRDVSQGGLCFNADHPVKLGSSIIIEIPIQSPPFRAQGTVAWCRPEGERYAIGVQFNDYSTRFSVRMVEQVCHIEDYRADVKKAEGRQLTSEEAAREWIDRFAGQFPGCS